MSKKRRDIDSNVNQNSGGINPTLMIIIRLEFAFELRRRELKKMTEDFGDAERQIQSLLEKAYGLLQTGESQIEIALILKEIITIARRSHFWGDRGSKEEHEESSG